MEVGSSRTRGGARIFRVSGPVVIAESLDSRMYDVVHVGNDRLMGEVIGIEDDQSVIQVYEETELIRPGDPVETTGEPLSAELGPGLLSAIYDGIQRPLPAMAENGTFIQRGMSIPSLPRDVRWEFVPTVAVGDDVSGGDAIGYVQETPHFRHRILVPPGFSGTVREIRAGSFFVTDTVCVLEDGTPLSLMHRWPVKNPRPVREKRWPDAILVTGQRILDTLFPLAKGGTAAIPGPFGSGKTITQQQLAKWADADVIVYIGCGERGNEMTDVLVEFPGLTDPKTGSPLMERTVLIANTSNMPVAAREASIYTGITIAEYFRDMGYDVALMADSTSRWAEAMREISSRLEELPGEEGYPAYLASRLADFYERAGRVETLSGGEGSVTIIGAVSPQGGDFNEPVTQNTLRVTKAFWALDDKLANRRHFPAINWLRSYSLYREPLTPGLEASFHGWEANRQRLMDILSQEDELSEIVQLVGSDALPEDQQLTLELARLIREYFLQQDAFHPVDTFCPLEKQYLMASLILLFSAKAYRALGLGHGISEITAVPSKALLARTKFEGDYTAYCERVRKQIEADFGALLGGA
ncbi:MAG: V-type ATP synthase subunit A [Candidatus Methanofastidiosa archaeon]|nr:V-type ATP synthase subunit A [Candidatus Methanofastidiosa archaeon]